MTFEYELTYVEYVESLQAAARTRGDWSRLPHVVGISTCAVAFVLLVARPDGGGPVTPVLLMGLSFFTAFYPTHWSHRQLKDRWANDPRLRQPVRVTVNEDEISWSAPASRVQLKWYGIQDVSETRRLILLHRSPHDFIPIPKRAFASPDALNQFRGILSEKVPGRSKGFPVVRNREDL
jgi:hypothetical protein